MARAILNGQSSGFAVTPVANLAATSQVRLGQAVVIDFEGAERELAFHRDDSETARSRTALDRAQARQAGGQYNYRPA